MMIDALRAKNAAVIAGVVGALAVLLWNFPPFRIVPLKGVQDQQQVAAFDAAPVAAQFWEGKLLPATASGLEVKELFAAFAKRGDAARQLRDGAVGAGAFLVKGTGHVTTIEEEAVVVVIDGADTKVKLFTGLLFGNCVRDATGLLDMSAYPDSQHFNDLSTQLNMIVETKVAPGLRGKAAVGKAIRFAGCAELQDGDGDGDGDGTKPERLLIIPLRVEWL